MVESVRRGFQSQRSSTLDYRLAQLRNLKRMINENLSKLFEAAWTDLHKVSSLIVLVPSSLL